MARARVGVRIKIKVGAGIGVRVGVGTRVWAGVSVVTCSLACAPAMGELPHSRQL